MASWTDDFNRASLGANWSGSVGGDLQIQSSTYVIGVSTADNSMYWNANTPAAAQYAQVNVGNIGTNRFRGPFVRGSATDWVFLDANGNNGQWTIEWYNGGLWTQIGAAYAVAPAANDIGKITASGSAFEGFVNGTSRISGSNASAPSTGYTGLYCWTNTTSETQDDFEGGDLGPTIVAVGQATETDLAQAITVPGVGFSPRLNATWLNFSARGQAWYHFWQDTAAAGHIIAVGQATETDLAQSIAWAPKNRLVAQVTETDLAQTISRVTTVSVGQASEADLAQALAARKTRAVGQAVESDLSQAIGRQKTKQIGQPSETDLAQPFSWRKTATIGQVVETDLAQAIGRTKAKTIGQTTEADLAQAITRLGATVVAVGQAFETDTSQAIAWAPKRRLVGQADETDMAQAITGPAPPPPPIVEAHGGSGVAFRMRRERQLEILQQEEEELLLLLL